MEKSYKCAGPTKRSDPVRMESDPDYVISKKHGNSLAAVLRDFPDGVPERTAARMLDMSESEVEQIYQGVVLRLRHLMKVSLQE